MTQENMAANALLGAAAGAGGAVGAAVSSLFAAEGFLGNMFGATQGFKVDRESVLQAGKIINSEIDKLQEKLAAAASDLRISADDEVNKAIADAWNSRLVEGDESYAGRVRQYLKSLMDLVDQLRTAAASYGFTDEEVESALGPKNAG